MSELPPIVRAADEQVAEHPLPGAVGMPQRHSPRRLSSPHASKFKAVTAGLVGLGVAAMIVAGAVLVSTGTSGPSAPWSAWSPPDGGSLGTREIADHLAPLYRISPLDQLAVVTVVDVSNSAPGSSAGASSSAGTGASSSGGLHVAVRPDSSSSAVSVLSGKTVAFNLCGIGGANCAIGVGQPSPDRLLLLRREALELALYTFKYVGGVQNVVAILPPGHTTPTSTLSPKPPSGTASSQPLSVAVLFLHDELKPWLSQPVDQILPERFPPTLAEVRAAPEAGLIEQITARGLFRQRLVQAQDGSSLIVLDPMPPQ